MTTPDAEAGIIEDTDLNAAAHPETKDEKSDRLKKQISMTLVG